MFFKTKGKIKMAATPKKERKFEKAKALSDRRLVRNKLSEVPKGMRQPLVKHSKESNKASTKHLKSK